MKIPILPGFITIITGGRHDGYDFSIAGPHCCSAVNGVIFFRYPHYPT